MTTYLSPRYSLISFNVFKILLGDSRMTIVLSSACSLLNKVCLPFFFGRNPSYAILLMSSPEILAPVTMEEAPGIPATFISLFNISFTSSNPGSEIHGVPASVTNAIFLPSSNRLNIFCI